jgi:hypothetical protein
LTKIELAKNSLLPKIEQQQQQNPQLSPAGFPGSMKKSVA